VSDTDTSDHKKQVDTREEEQVPTTDQARPFMGFTSSGKSKRQLLPVSEESLRRAQQLLLEVQEEQKGADGLAQFAEGEEEEGGEGEEGANEKRSSEENKSDQDPKEAEEVTPPMVGFKSAGGRTLARPSVQAIAKASKFYSEAQAACEKEDYSADEESLGKDTTTTTTASKGKGSTTEFSKPHHRTTHNNTPPQAQQQHSSFREDREEEEQSGGVPAMPFTGGFMTASNKPMKAPSTASLGRIRTLMAEVEASIKPEEVDNEDTSLLDFPEKGGKEEVQEEEGEEEKTEDVFKSSSSGEDMKMTGFMTAGRKSLKPPSGVALARAHRLMQEASEEEGEKVRNHSKEDEERKEEDEDDAMQEDPKNPFMGFMTGARKAMKPPSGESLARAHRLMQEASEEEEWNRNQEDETKEDGEEEGNQMSVMKGFMTAGQKPMKPPSRDSLARAQRIMQDANEEEAEEGNHNKEDEDVMLVTKGFMTAGQKPMKPPSRDSLARAQLLMQEANEKEQEKGNKEDEETKEEEAMPVVTGFMTAGKKPMKPPSRDSLARAQRIMQEASEEEEGNHNKEDETKEDGDEGNQMPAMTGFMTAGKKPMKPPSQESLARAQRLMQEVSEEEEGEKGNNNNNNNKEAEETKEDAMPVMTGFMTAGKKPMKPPSGAALARAQRIMQEASEEEGNRNKEDEERKEDDEDDAMTGGQKPMKPPSRRALAQAHRLMEEASKEGEWDNNNDNNKEENGDPMPLNPKPLGFMTGNRKSMKPPSADSLSRAQKLMHDDDDDPNSNTNNTNNNKVLVTHPALQWAYRLVEDAKNEGEHETDQNDDDAVGFAGGMHAMGFCTGRGLPTARVSLRSAQKVALLMKSIADEEDEFNSFVNQSQREGRNLIQPIASEVKGVGNNKRKRLDDGDRAGDEAQLSVGFATPRGRKIDPPSAEAKLKAQRLCEDLNLDNSYLGAKEGKEDEEDIKIAPIVEPEKKKTGVDKKSTSTKKGKESNSLAAQLKELLKAGDGGNAAALLAKVQSLVKEDEEDDEDEKGKDEEEDGDGEEDEDDVDMLLSLGSGREDATQPEPEKQPHLSPGGHSDDDGTYIPLSPSPSLSLSLPHSLNILLRVL